MSYGDLIQDARRLTHLSLGAFTANTTVVAAPRFGVPPGTPKVRVLGIHVVCSAVPADDDGTMLLNVINYDASEAADDALVSSQDLEALILVANKTYECTLATEGTEKELTLEAGDSIRCTLVNNSAAISGGNPNVTVIIEWMAVFDATDQTRVQHASAYTA